MKVMFMAPTMEVGGAERQLVQTANGLLARGHDVSLALFRTTGPLLGHLVPQIVIHDLKKKSRWSLLSFLVRTIRLIRGSRPDVVYSYLGVPNLLALLMKLACPGVRIVWSIRASDMDLKQYDWLTRVCCYLEMILSQFPDHIVVNSEAGREYSVAQGFFTRSMSVVFNGIDTDYFIPDRVMGQALREEWDVLDTDIVIGIVGRIDPMKNHRSFIQAARIVATHFENVKFVCIGEGDASLTQELRDFGGDMNLGENLIWAGSQGAMNKVYNALDICALSSITEGFPNVLGEAMSCGVPCVTTDVGDAAIIVGDTRAVVPKDDSEALARVLIEMIDRKERRELANPRQRIVDMFSLARMVEGTERVLSEVLE